MGLSINSDIYVVLDYAHVKPGKGSSFVRVKIRNIKTQNVLERTFRSSETLEDVPLEDRRFQYLYEADGDYHFMDIKTYEQITVKAEVIGDNVRYLQENIEVVGTCYHEAVLKITLPMFIIFEVAHTEPGFKGDSSRSGNKPAQTETGATIQVPLFINIGDKVKIDTRTGAYVERVQK